VNNPVTKKHPGWGYPLLSHFGTDPASTPASTIVTPLAIATSKVLSETLGFCEKGRSTTGGEVRKKAEPFSENIPAHMKNVIAMEDYTAKGFSRANLRDRRYAIRFPFAADVQFINLETGDQAEGVTSDISLGGCFACTSKPMKAGARIRVTLMRKDGKFEALGMVRIVKPRVGMGVEFIDVDRASMGILERWLGDLRRGKK